MNSRIIPLSPDGQGGRGLPPEDLSDLPQAKVVEGVVPAHGFVGYTDPTGRYAVGVAEYEAGTIEIDSWPMEKELLFDSKQPALEPELRGEKLFKVEDFVLTATVVGCYIDDVRVQPLADTWVGNIGDDDGTLYNFADWKTASSEDANSIDDDPTFVNAGADSFQLQLGSPCIEAGFTVGLTRDYAGTVVAQGDSVDIGAYEYE